MKHSPVYKNSFFDNRQIDFPNPADNAKNKKRMQKQISYGKDYCKKPNDKDSNKRWG